MTRNAMQFVKNDRKGFFPLSNDKTCVQFQNDSILTFFVELQCYLYFEVRVKILVLQHRPQSPTPASVYYKWLLHKEKFPRAKLAILA